MVARMAKIGLVPGQDFDPSKLDFLDREVIKTVPKLALVDMGVLLKEQKTTNGWLYFTKGVGNFGTDYRLRGMANLLGPGWNRAQDAVYPLSQKDAKGDTYDGAKYKYVVRFEKGQLPPAEAFWSLTMYDDRLLLRAESDPSLRPRAARQARRQSRRLGGHVSAGRVAGQGQGGELASRAQGQVQAGDADLFADDRAAFDPRRLLDAAAGDTDAVTGTCKSDGA